MKKHLIIAAIAILLNACSDDLKNSPINLGVEYGTASIDTREPRFSWMMDDSVKGARQTAYQVLVATKHKNLREKKADVWDSGKILSDQSVFVPYSGNSLESGKRYYWTVRLWNEHDEVSEWSPSHTFDVGLLEKSAWQAEWIGAFESETKVDSVRQRSIILRKNFKLKKNIRCAKAYVTGLGTYQFFLNGEKVSTDLLAPGWTDYPNRILYQVYDVTQFLEKGSNAAGIILGNGWYSSGLGWKGTHVYSNGPLMSLVQIEIEYVDGSKSTIISDDSWKWHFSPITENTLYHGESYDARLEIDGWNTTSVDDSDWDMADVFENQEAILSLNTSPPIQVTRKIEPVSINPLENGSYVFDMGLNMTGGIRLNVAGDEGTEIIMKFAELLHEDGSVAQENLRSARATDKYILKGQGTEVWEPAFTYHGFRYVEISGLPAPPDSSTVLGLNFHSAAAETGTFKCSNDMLNSIQRNIQNGQRSNMFSVPTDCPQRDERLGWMGDAQIFAATSCYNMDMLAFYAKWIRDIADSQSAEGWVTDVNPAIVVSGPAKPAWADAFLIVPWEVYRFYGDRKILKTFYDDFKKFVEYMHRNADKDGLYIYDRNGFGGYADWIAVVESPKQAISAAYYYYSTSLLAKFAEILGYTADVQTYDSLANVIQGAFQKRYFNEKLASYEGGTQTANLLPLNLGLTPNAYLAKVAENVKANVVERGYHPSTGFLGTKYLLPSLSDYGYNDIAYRTAINEEYPSWGYMVKKGATSMWELWNSDTEKPEGMNSRNHFALGSIGEWFYSHLAGIKIDNELPGFKHSIIAPMPPKVLDWTEAEILTPYGKLSSKWKKEKSIFTLNVVVPPNTTATIKVPILAGSRMELYAGGKVLVKEMKAAGSVHGFSLNEITNESVSLEVESGTYKFELLY